MSFASILDSYCGALNCTSKEIAQRCGISPSALSRYRNGGRTPNPESDVVGRLVAGIVELSNEQGLDGLYRGEVLRRSLQGSLSGSRMLGISFASRFDALMDLTEMHNVEVARVVKVSQSYISRIRSGQRMPSGYEEFALRFARMIAVRSTELGIVSKLVALLSDTDGLTDWTQFDLGNPDDLADAVHQWLLGNNIFEADVAAIEGLLEDLDNLYFVEPLKEVETHEILPVKEGRPEPSFRFYRSMENMMQAEVAFFDTAAVYDARELWLSSDVPLLEMPITPEDLRQYVPGLANVIRKGGRVTVCHGSERSLTETIMLVKNWMPLYLTGSVTSLYLRGVGNRLFYHVNFVCEVCALISEAVRGHSEDGQYFFTTQPEDIAYYRKKMAYVYEHATTMIDVYRESIPGRREAFEEFLADHSKQVDPVPIVENRYRNLRILSFPDDCVVISILTESPIHLVIYHPRMCYVISHLK